MIKEEKDFKENTIDGDFTKPRKDVPMHNKRINKGKKSKGKKNKKWNRNSSNKGGVEANFPSTTKGGVSSENDISWYSKNPELLRQAGNLAWGYKLGLPINYRNENFDPNASENFISRLPGFMFVGVIPGPGVTADEDTFQESDAINLAAKDQYAYVRYANSGHANYEAQDLMMYYLAWDEVQMEIYDAMRAYGIANITNTENRYMPRALVQALGWDYDEITSTRANFASKINSAIARLGAFPVPKGMPYFKRHEWLFENLFTDETSLKSQIFGFKKVMYRMFEHNPDNVEGGSLIAHIRPGATGVHLMTPDTWYKNVLEMINRIHDDEDMGIIMGDIIKAWGTNNCMTLDYMSQDYIVQPAYSEEVKAQFENMYIHASLLTDQNSDAPTYHRSISVYDITQNPNIDMGRIVYRPYIKMPSILANPEFRPTDDRLFNAINPTSGNALINIHKDTPDVDDVVVCTRGISPAKLSVNDVKETPEPARVTSTQGYISDKAYTAYGKIMTAASEIFVDGRIFTFVPMSKSNYATDYDSGLSVRSCNSVQITERSQSQYPSPGSTILSYPEGEANDVMEWLDPFAQHVNIWSVKPYWLRGSGDKITGLRTIDYNKFYDVDNYTTIHPETLRNLHDQIMLSLFNVPIEIVVKGAIGK